MTLFSTPMCYHGNFLRLNLLYIKRLVVILINLFKIKYFHIYERSWMPITTGKISQICTLLDGSSTPVGVSINDIG